MISMGVPFDSAQGTPFIDSLDYSYNLDRTISPLNSEENLKVMLFWPRNVASHKCLRYHRGEC
jgi:hypothetical protein